MKGGGEFVRFEFATATRILFGPGTLGEVGPLAAEMGQRALVVTGSAPERARPLLDALNEQRIAGVTFPVASEPTTDVTRQGVQRARDQRCDLVIGFGGGSALDTGKAIAAMLTNEGHRDCRESEEAPFHGGCNRA